MAILIYGNRPWELSIDFRLTAAFVTDRADSNVNLASTLYPTRDKTGKVYGWETAGTVAGRDRSTTIDTRLAGNNAVLNNAATSPTYRVDLPSAGLYWVYMTIGDGAGATAATNYAVVQDGTAARITISALATSTTQVADVNSRLWTTATWLSGNTPKLVYFSTKILRIVLGDPAHAATLSSCLCHLRIVKASPFLKQRVPGGFPTTIDKFASVDAFVQTFKDSLYNVDAFVQSLKSSQHSVDAFVQFLTGKAHNVDAFVQIFSSPVHNIDALVQLLFNPTHNIDALVQLLSGSTHNIDAIVQLLSNSPHNVDAIVQLLTGASHSADAYMGWNFVQKVEDISNYQIATVASVTIAITPTAGNLLILTWQVGGSTTVEPVATITDNQGNVWNKLPTFYDTVARQGLGMAYAQNVAGAPTTITIAFNPVGDWISDAVHEYSGLLASDALNASNLTNISAAGITAIDAGSVLTDTPGELIFSVTVDFSNSSDAFTAGVGYTPRVNQAFEGLFTEDQRQLVAGTFDVNPTVSWTPSTTNVASIIAAFRVVPPLSPKYSVDALVQLLSNPLYNIDALVQLLSNPAHSVDAYIQALSNPAHNIDAVVQLLFNKTHTVDASVQGLFNPLYSVDVLVQILSSSVHNVDALVQIFSNSLYNVDALVQLFLNSPHNVDALVQIFPSSLYSVDAYVQFLSNPAYNLDALVQVLTNPLYNVDAVVQFLFGSAHNIDAFIQFLSNPSYSVNAFVQSLASSSYGVDSYVQGLVSDFPHNVDAFVQIIPISDPFTTNGPLSSNWTIIEGAFLISSNKLAITAIGADLRALAYWNAAIFPPNQYAELTLTTIPLGNRGLGPAVRVSSSAETCYGFHVNNNTIFISRIISGVTTVIATTPWAPTTGDVFRLEVIGNQLTARINGVTLLTAVDSNITSGAAGIQGLRAGAPDPQVNNWSAGALFQTTSPHNIDAFVQFLKSSPHNVDALIQLLSNSSYNVDALIQILSSSPHNVDALVQLLSNSSHNIDSLIQILSSSPHNIDALIQMSLNSLYSVDALIQLLLSPSHNVDALAELLSGKTYNIDAFIQALFASLYSIDAFVFSPPKPQFFLAGRVQFSQRLIQQVLLIKEDGG